MKKTVKGWVGICDGEITAGIEKHTEKQIWCAYLWKYEAKQAYECVVPCTITYTTPNKPTKGRKKGA